MIYAIMIEIYDNLALEKKALVLSLIDVTKRIEMVWLYVLMGVKGRFSSKMS